MFAMVMHRTIDGIRKKIDKYAWVTHAVECIFLIKTKGHING